MSEQYNTTFNYFFTHKVIPHMFFSDLELFYSTIITNPNNLQIFMKNALRHAIDFVKQNPDIEPGSPVEEFEMALFGELETGVVVVNIPGCNSITDCSRIAFTCFLENARYFTCEFAQNILTNENILIAGEWTNSDNGYIHHNYGEIKTDKESIMICMDFAKGIKDILDTPLLDKNGEIAKQSIKAVETGDKYLKKIRQVI